MGKIIGIDLGTTNSVVAVMEGKEPKVIVNEEGDRITPSIVAWDDQGETLVGQIAKRQAITNPEGTIFSAKRFIGRRFEEVSDDDKRRVPFEVVRRENGDSGFKVEGRELSSPEVSAHVLRKLKRAAEAYLGEGDRASHAWHGRVTKRNATLWREMERGLSWPAAMRAPTQANQQGSIDLAAIGLRSKQRLHLRQLPDGSVVSSLASPNSR